MPPAGRRGQLTKPRTTTGRRLTHCSLSPWTPHALCQQCFCTGGQWDGAWCAGGASWCAGAWCAGGQWDGVWWAGGAWWTGTWCTGSWWTGGAW
ncbi:hypothetical protein GCM10022284_12740 [Streptomyces hundungensis]